jgi:multisubunit Na+/H+ antiporter MnhG subunit
MNKVMSLKTRELLVSGIVGAMWILFGVMQVLNVNKTIDLITNIVFLIVIVISIIPYFMKTEIQDEMARHNMDKARSMACELLMLGMMICVLTSTIIGGWVVDIKLVMSFLMGIGYIGKYIIFVISEKNGD